MCLCVDTLLCLPSGLMAVRTCVEYLRGQEDLHHFAFTTANLQYSVGHLTVSLSCFLCYLNATTVIAYA